MGKALIIGAGGVASVVVHKCVQNSQIFEEIMIASRTKSKCDALKEKLDAGHQTENRKIRVARNHFWKNEQTILSKWGLCFSSDWICRKG